MISAITIYIYNNEITIIDIVVDNVFLTKEFGNGQVRTNNILLGLFLFTFGESFSIVVVLVDAIV